MDFTCASPHLFTASTCKRRTGVRLKLADIIPEYANTSSVKLEVDLLEDVTWNEEAFDLLVMERQTKELVEAVVTNHLDEDRDTDVIHGKGNGLFILLHG